jgi:hypothetical protein
VLRHHGEIRPCPSPPPLLDTFAPALPTNIHLALYKSGETSLNQAVLLGLFPRRFDMTGPASPPGIEQPESVGVSTLLSRFEAIGRDASTAEPRRPRPGSVIHNPQPRVASGSAQFLRPGPDGGDVPRPSSAGGKKPPPLPPSRAGKPAGQSQQHNLPTPRVSPALQPAAVELEVPPIGEARRDVPNTPPRRVVPPAPPARPLSAIATGRLIQRDPECAIEPEPPARQSPPPAPPLNLDRQKLLRRPPPATPESRTIDALSSQTSVTTIRNSFT